MKKYETRTLIRCRKGAIKGERLVPGNSKTKRMGTLPLVQVPKVFLEPQEGHHTALKLPMGIEPKPSHKARLRFLPKFQGPVPTKHKGPLSEFTRSKLAPFITPKGGKDANSEGVSN